MQERLAKEPSLGILCRMPTEDPRTGPTLIGQPLKGKRFDVQKKRQLAAGLQVLWAGFRQFPSANLSPVGSSLPRKEPTAESITCFCVESLGFHLRRNRGLLASFLGKARVLQRTFEPGPS